MTTTPSPQGSRIARNCARALLRAYRAVLSPALGPACRYLPSCSVYAEQAIEEWGLPKGSALALKRLLRCHPFSAGGWDPVPSCPGRHTSSEKGIVSHG